MKAWRCENCGKLEVTRLFKPKWVRHSSMYHYGHWTHKSKVYDESDPWDFGGVVFCGEVKVARNHHFEGV